MINKLAVLLLLSFLIFQSCGDSENAIKPGGPSIFTFDVADDYLDDLSHEGGWIFITNEDGTVLDDAQLINGQSIKLEAASSASSSDGSTITILRINSFDGTPPEKFFDFQSFCKSAPDTYTLSRNQRVINVVGQSNIHVTDIPNPPYLATVLGPDISYTTKTIGINTADFSPQLSASPSNVTAVLFLDKDTPKYKQLLDIEVNNTSSLAYSTDWHDMEIKKNISFPGADYSYYSIQGVVDHDYDITYPMWSDSRSSNANSSLLPIYYAQNLESEIITSVQFRSGNKVYNMGFTGSEPPDSFTKINGEINLFSQSVDGFVLNVTGAADVHRTTGDYFYENETEIVSCAWDVYSPALPSTSFKTPEIPADLKERYPQLTGMVYVYSYPYLFDYSGITAYQNYLETKLKGENFFVNSKTVSAMWSIQ
jgi:hypothetical protein